MSNQNESNIVSLKKNNINDVNKKNKNKIPTYIYALGGLGEVGKNMYVFEQGEEIWIVDAGIMFSSSDELVGIDGIIPSFEYLQKKQKNIQGLIITHGHEDHIGAIPYLLKSVKIPVIYCQRLAAALISRKIRQKGISRPPLRNFNSNSSLKSKNFEINFFNVNHSIPESVGIILKTINGKIITTGDFKFDLTPLGQKTDFAKIAKLGSEGATLLLSDSTNALVDEFSISERDVSRTIDSVFKFNQDKRLILATFASNVYRTTAILKTALRYKRKVVIQGYSMDYLIRTAIKIDYIKVPQDLFIDVEKINRYKPHEVIVLCTGTQGEPLAALSRMATRRHKEIKINSNDLVVFSSSPIPGSFMRVEKIINELVKQGATVMDKVSNIGLHTTGHASKKEQMLMLSLVKPKFFMPIHGESLMLHEHKQTAIKCGVKPSNCFVLKNGIRLKLLNEVASIDGSVPAGDVLIDGNDVGSEASKIVTDRIKLTKQGVLGVVVGIDSSKNKIIHDPELISSGCFKTEIPETIQLFEQISEKVKKDLNEFFTNGQHITFAKIKEVIRESALDMVVNSTTQQPIVIALVLDHKTNN